MSVTPAIRVDGLSKQYVIGANTVGPPTFREMLTGLFRWPVERWRRSAAPAEQRFWALRDVSFEVSPGEVVGIIGSNGAGKSTLLKILCRITEPTLGRIEIRGRVASLLEVGTGFHPELTGRENIFLNGAILGMTRREILAKFDEIVAFAEVGRFIDTPVKRYSSGMYMRLAFAVAAHLDPEILIVDEVLAVGDAQFQKKCLGKMHDVASGGRTVLFVSHNLTAVQTLCSRAIWIEKGQVVGAGHAKDVVAEYIQSGGSARVEQTWAPGEGPSGQGIELLEARVVAADGASCDAFTTSTPLTIAFRYRVLAPQLRLNLVAILRTPDDICAFASASITDGKSGGHFTRGTYRSVCAVPARLLNDSTYRLEVLFVRDGTDVILRVVDVLTVAIHDEGADRGGWYGDWPGALRPILKWDTHCEAEG